MADADDQTQQPGDPDPVEQAEGAMDAAGAAAESLAGSGDPAAEAALAAAMAAIGQVNAQASGAAKPSAGATPPAAAPNPKPASASAPAAEAAAAFVPPEFTSAPAKPLPSGLDLLSDVNLDVRIELGRTTMYVEDVLKLGEGAVVELEKLAGDPVDIYVNGRHVARGEVLVLNDNFCVRVSEILDLQGRDAAKAAGG
jgi:flagellar motor switch protein FliN/FliY